MIAPGVLVLLGGLSFGLIGVGIWLMREMARQDVRQRRIAMVQQGANVSAREPLADQGSMVRLIASLGILLSRSGMLPGSTLVELEQTLVSVGLQQGNALGLFIGGKIVLLVMMPLIVFIILHSFSVSPMLRLIYIVTGAVVGLLLPDFIIRRRRTRYLRAVGSGLPDALDMLVICTEAGLGLEMGLERVAAEIQPVHAAIAAELKITSAELRILADRRRALTNMGTRTGLETLKRLGATLIQTLQYGTPLSQALRTLSTEMRYEMLMRFEAQAARLPVLLTVPMILFILPCIFIVVGGPAGLTVARSFTHH